MPRKFRILTLGCCLSGLLIPDARAVAEDRTSDEAASIEFFEKKIRPILVARCVECHGAEKQKGGLRLDHPEGLTKGGDQGTPFTPKKPEESLLIEAVGYQVEGFQMPPQGKISDDEIGLLTEWIRRGAILPKGNPNQTTGSSSPQFNIDERKNHWSYQPVKRPESPVLPKSDSLKSDEILSPIDLFIEKKLEEKHLMVAGRADRQTLLRRVTFDLTGLPPNADEISEFISDDRPDAFERQLDILLASPRYGERWARHWLDLVRYAETLGHEFDFELPEAWRYRDYVIRAFNRDLPYDVFVKEHIAGDLFQPQRVDPTSGISESGIATAFFWFGEASHSPVDVRQSQADRIDNQIDVLSKAFLGQSVACARCHDHKFDAISQKDYYALAGFLKSSRYDQRPVGDETEQYRRVSELSVERERVDALLRKRMMPWWESQLRKASADLQRHLRSLPDMVAENPFYVAKELLADRAESSTTPFVDRASDLRVKLEAQTTNNANVREVVFATFAPDERSRWTTEGTAFHEVKNALPILSSEEIGKAKKVRLIEPSWADSSSISKRLEGTLRSQTFVIEKNFIHVKAAGRGARVNVVIDGFPIIRDPIYGGLTIRLDSDNASWRTFNVSKWVGHRAYIEFVDQSVADLSHGSNEATPVDGYFSAREVIFSSHSHAPGEPVHPLNIEILRDPIPTSIDEVMARYQASLRNALHLISDSSAPITSELMQAGRLLAASMSLDILESDYRNELPWNEIEQLALLTREIERIQHSWEPPRYSPGFAEGTGENEFVFIRGNHKTLSTVANRRFLEAIDGPDSLRIGSGSGRKELSERLANSTNPLLSRVWANRIWKYHFGEGIVRSPDDFGKMGQPPSHPELLDWLASELVESGWSTKHLHRLMLESRAYQMTSTVSDESREQDPRNEYLTRMPLRRLEAEAIRDSLLAVSGRFDTGMEGPGIDPFLTEFMPPIGRPAKSGPVDGAGRRSVYLKVRRNFLSPLLLAFDYPLPQTTIGRRNTSNVPAQALAMLNDEFILNECRNWAASLVTDFKTSDERIARAYLDAFGRPVKSSEAERVKSFLASEGVEADKDHEIQIWTAICHSLVNAKEFIFIP